MYRYIIRKEQLLPTVITKQNKWLHSGAVGKITHEVYCYAVKLEPGKSRDAEDNLKVQISWNNGDQS